MRASAEWLARFAAVEKYYETRSRELGDIYGWGPVQLEPTPVARLLVDVAAGPVPIEIDGIRIVTLEVDRPLTG